LSKSIWIEYPSIKYGLVPTSKSARIVIADEVLAQEAKEAILEQKAKQLSWSRKIKKLSWYWKPK
jgi:hypothetical protein